jgi:galactokinase
MSETSGTDERLVRRLAEHRDAFVDTFGDSRGTSGAVRLFFSPGRVNLMGAHLDYNGGPVMPDGHRPRHVLRRPGCAPTGACVFASTLERGEVELELDRLSLHARGAAGSTIRGRAASCCAPLAPDAPRRRALLFGGNLPVGAGPRRARPRSASALPWRSTARGSSSLAPMRARGHRPARRTRVRRRALRHHGSVSPSAWRARHRLLWLDCKDGSFEHLPIDHTSIAIAVADSGVRRELAQGAFNQRVAEAAEAFERLSPFVPGASVLRDVPLATVHEHSHALPPHIARRALHVAGEVERTFIARDALLRGDVATFGAQIFEAHRSLRDLYEVTVPELDLLVDAAREQPGILGARVTGAGFGGCVVVLARRDQAQLALERVADSFASQFGRRPGVRVFGGDPGPRELPT